MGVTASHSAPAVISIVLNYCSYEDTLACVASLAQLDYPSNRILLIDNGSPDGSGPRLEKELPDVSFLQLETNLGYAGGNNVGMREAIAAGAAYVFIVNPDVRLQPDSLALLVSGLRKEPKRAAAMPLQLSDEAADPADPPIDPRIVFNLLEPNGIDPRSDSFRRAEWIPLPRAYGAALLISVDALQRVGLFDPLYFCYGEEEDLCRRLRFHGLEVGIVPRAVVVHKRTVERRDRPGPGTVMRRYLRGRNSYLFQVKDPYSAVWRSSFRVGARIAKNLARASVKGKRQHVRRTAASARWLLRHWRAVLDHRRAEAHGAGKGAGDAGIAPPYLCAEKGAFRDPLLERYMGVMESRLKARRI